MSKSRPTIFTVGHTNKGLEKFIAMIRAAGADAVVDVRSFPRSRTNPQFNIDTLDFARYPKSIS